MDWQTILHWVYVAGMAIGALHFWTLSRNPRGVPQYEYLVAIFIPGVAEERDELGRDRDIPEFEIVQ